MDYMVMLRGNFSDWKNIGPKETEAFMQKYMNWVEDLKGEKRFKGGAALTDLSKMLRGQPGSTAVTDGPYAETKEALTGYFLIEADSLNHAVEIAHGCPALLHGDSVEVIQVSGDQ